MSLTKRGYFGWAGGGKDGAVVDAWLASRFGVAPSEGSPPPDINPADGGPVTTADAFGGPGAFTIAVPVYADYWLRFQYGGIITWSFCPKGSLSNIPGPWAQFTNQGVLALPQGAGTVVTLGKVAGPSPDIQLDAGAINIVTAGTYIMSTGFTVAVANGSTDLQVLAPAFFGATGYGGQVKVIAPVAGAFTQVLTAFLVVTAPGGMLISLQPDGGSGDESLADGALTVTMGRLS